MSESKEVWSENELENRPIIDRFDALIAGIKPLLEDDKTIPGRHSFLGSRNTPDVSIGTSFIRLGVYQPSDEGLDSKYSQSILGQKLELVKQHGTEYPAPVFEYYVRRDQLDDNDEESLRQIAGLEQFLIEVQNADKLA